MFPNVNKCFSVEQCPPFDQSILKYDITSIKYICHKLHINYLEILYDKLPCVSALSKAKTFRDLISCKYVLNKCNQTYPNDLYKGLEAGIQENLAIALLDLEGIKYIYNGTDYLKLYANFNSLEAAEFAIKLDDIRGIAYLIQNQTSNQINSLLKLAYYNEHLQIAEYLITKTKTKFHLNYLIRANPSLDFASYEKHLFFLNTTSYFTQQDYINFHSLITTIFSKLNHNKNSLLITNSIYSDEYSSVNKVMDFLDHAIDRLHPTVQDIVKVISINNFEKSKIDYLLPSKGIKAFFDKGSMINPYKDDFIYIPFSHQDFNSSFIHELAHAFFYLLFCNNAKPYGENDVLIYKEYNRAVNETLNNIFKEATKDKYSSFNDKSFETFLWLNYWHLMEYKENKATEFVFQKISNDSHRYSVIKKQELLEKLYKKIFQELGWSEKLALVLNKIFDYVKRPEDEKQAEFLVRIPELYAQGIDNQTMKLFKPAVKYWEKFITPIAKNYIDEHFLKCLTFINNDHNLDNCVLRVLSVDQQGAILEMAAETGCVKCVKALYQQIKVIENIKISAKQSASSKAAYHINFCVKYCPTVNKNDNSQEIKCYYIDYVDFWHFLMWQFGDITYQCTTVVSQEIYNNPYYEIVDIIYQDISETLNTYQAIDKTEF